MEQVTVSWLQTIETLQGVPDEQLQWLIDHSITQQYNDGDYIFKRDEPLSGTYFLFSGKLRLYRWQNGVRTELVTMHEREITGFLPYSRGKVAFGDGVAVGPTVIMTLPVDQCPELIKTYYELTQALVSIMSNRVRESTALMQQNEKMMALGKLSAGLAHELNNPAASIVRNAASLKKHLQSQPDLFAKLVAVHMDVDRVGMVKAEITRILDRENTTRLSLRERSQLESDMAEWLDDHEIANPDEIAENLVSYGFSINDLGSICRHMTSEAATPVFEWIHDTLLSAKMVADIHDASQRIASLITSIKTFTHMDRGQDKQFTSVETGLHNTLTMLGHKLKECKVKVVEQYDPELPPINMLVGELNQVWTNLIDNALDAMESNGGGTLTIKTRKDRDYAEIVIADDGPGIPDEIQNQIFDPFFTTKAMGKGTGMGLEVVQRIIKQQHNGSIKVKSQPGHTEFIVCIPINNR